MGGHNLERERIRSMERYWSLKSRGVCTKCGKEPHIEGSTMCEKCSYHDSLLRKKRYDTLSDEKREHKNLVTRERKKRYREQGRCICGRPITDRRYKLCLECRLYARRKQAEYRPSNNWIELGLCRWCGKETADGTVYCEEHLRQMREQFEKNVRPNGVNIADNSYFRGLNHAFWEERKTNKIKG